MLRSGMITVPVFAMAVTVVVTADAEPPPAHAPGPTPVRAQFAAVSHCPPTDVRSETAKQRDLCIDHPKCGKVERSRSIGVDYVLRARLPRPAAPPAP